MASKVIQKKMKMLSQGVAKGNLSVTTRRVITENAPFANRSESDSELLRTFEVTSNISEKYFFVIFFMVGLDNRKRRCYITKRLSS